MAVTTNSTSRSRATQASSGPRAWTAARWPWCTPRRDRRRPAAAVRRRWPGCGVARRRPPPALEVGRSCRAHPRSAALVGRRASVADARMVRGPGRLGHGSPSASPAGLAAVEDGGPGRRRWAGGQRGRGDGEGLTSGRAVARDRPVDAAALAGLDPGWSSPYPAGVGDGVRGAGAVAGRDRRRGPGDRQPQRGLAYWLIGAGLVPDHTSPRRDRAAAEGRVHIDREDETIWVGGRVVDVVRGDVRL